MVAVTMNVLRGVAWLSVQLVGVFLKIQGDVKEIYDFFICLYVEFLGRFQKKKKRCRSVSLLAPFIYIFHFCTVNRWVSSFQCIYLSSFK